MSTKQITFYNFCQNYYGKETKATLKQRQNYGRAIGYTENVVRNIFLYKSTVPIQEYFESERKHPLTVEFLKHLDSIITNYENFFDRFIRDSITLEIPTPGKKYDKLRSKNFYLLDKQKDSFIILTYGKSDNPIEEFNILKVLCENYLTKEIDFSLNSFEYWDLTNGIIDRVLSSDFMPMNLDSIQPTINRLASF